MKAIIYCRVSSKEQVEGTSLEVQEAACRDYAAANNLVVERVFIEQGESAKFADRTQLLELIEFCRTHKGTLNVLIVWKLDRFARNVSDHYSVKATLAKFGVCIVSVTEPIDSKPEGRLMETILAGFAQFDNDIRAMRTVQGMRRKIEEGIFPWKPPFGYRSVGQGLGKKVSPDEPDPSTFSKLQRTWRQFATGAYSQAEIGRLMTSWGLATARGRAFSPQSIFQMFTNSYYAGVLIDPWNGSEHIGRHTPLVTREEFVRVQTVIKGRNKSRPQQKDRREFPLRGLVRCESCEHVLTGSVSRGNGGSYPYYHCRMRGCSRYGKSVAASHVHIEFKDYLDFLTPSETNLTRLRTYLLTAIEQKREECKAANDARSERATRLGRELDELIRMRAQGLVTDEEFLRQKKTILQQRQGIEVSQMRLPTAEEVRHHLDEIVSPLQNLRTTWESLEPRFRARFQQLLFPVGFVNGQVGTAQTARIFNVLSPPEDADSCEVPPTCDSWNQIIAEIYEFHKLFAVPEVSQIAA